MLRINLLPPSLRPKLSVNLDLLFMVVFVGSLLGILASFSSVQNKVRKSGAEVATLEAQSADQKKRISELRARETESQASATQSLVSGRKEWNPFLKELTYILPQDIWITKISLKGDKGVVDIQMSGKAPSQRSVNRMLGRLERSVTFQHVKLNSSALEPSYSPSLYSFDFAVPDLFSAEPDRGLASETKK